MQSFFTTTILFAVFLLQPCLLFSQPTPTSGKVTITYVYRHFTAKDGLPQIQITNIFEDSQGFLWIGTKFGITRWDGNSFYTPKFPERNVMSQVSDICELKKGEIASVNFLYPYLSVVNGNKIYRKYFSELPTNVSLESIYKNSDTTVLLHFKSLVDNSNKNYILRYNFLTQKVSKIIETGNLQEILSASINEIISYNTIGNEQIIYRFENDKLSDSIVVRFMDFFEMNSKLPLSNYAFENGTIRYSHLMFTDKLKNEVKLLKIKNEKNRISNFKVINNEFYYRNEIGEFCKVVNGAKVLIMSNLPLMTTMFVAKNGTIWVGTEQGVYCIFYNRIKEIRLNCNSNSLDNIWSFVREKSNYFYNSYRTGVVVSSDSNLSWKKDVEYYRKEYNTYPQVNNSETKIAGLGAFVTKKGGVIMPHAGGLFYIYKNKVNHLKSRFATTEVTKFIQKQNGEIYFSSYSNINKFNEETLVIDSFISPQKIGLETITNLDVDREDNLCAMNKSGFVVFKNNKWQFIAKTPIITSAIDNQNNYWMVGKGKFYLYSNGKLDTIDNKLFPLLNSDIKIFNTQWMVIGNQTDVILFNYAEYLNSKKIVYKRLYANNGYDALETGQNSMFLDVVDSSINWACSDKIVQFYPNSYINNSVIKKPIVIDAFALNNERQIPLFDSFNKINNCIPKQFRTVKIEFTSPELMFNADLQFRYRLAGVDKLWQFTKEHSLVITVDKPNEYNFEIQSSTDGINWSESTNLQLIFKAFWYETLLAKFGMVAFLLIIIYSLIQLISSRIAKNKVAELNQKLNIEKLKNENLNLSLINTKGKFIPHFSGNILNSITYFFEIGESKKGIEYLSKYTELNKQILLGADNPSTNLETEITFLKNYLELEQLRFEGDIDFKLSIDVNVDRKIHVPSLILHTFCENAIKHGIMSKNGKGLLCVNINNYLQDFIHIVIEDDGIGREAASKIKMESTGQGLKILTKQIELYNSFNTLKIEISFNDVLINAKISGTKVEVLIPKIFNYKNNYE